MDNRIGILSPTYFWGLPSIVKDFLEKAHFKYKGNPIVFTLLRVGRLLEVLAPLPRIY